MKFYADYVKTFHKIQYRNYNTSARHMDDYNVLTDNKNY